MFNSIDTEGGPLPQSQALMTLGKIRSFYVLVGIVTIYTI
jgi:hypothetical protein